MYKPRLACRACESEELTGVFDLGLQPLANNFVKPGEVQQGYAPLRVMFCPHCTLAQLSVVVDPEILYSRYAYVTSRSQTMQNHFTELWSAIQAETAVESVVEIGSNDGWFLNFCRERGVDTVVGIDPAVNLKPPEDSGIIAMGCVFDEVAAGMAKTCVPSPSVIVARHVFAHIDDWRGFLKSLDVLATRDTLIVIECPYVGDLLRNGEFDTIYHEHLSYISIRALQAWLAHSPFHLHKVQRYPIHGGALVFMLRRNDSPVPAGDSVATYLDQENIGLGDWLDFSAKCENKMESLLSVVRHHMVRGEIVCGFGASAKSTVWINACGLSHQELAFITDSTPLKWGTVSPGTHIPIVPEAELANAQYAVLFSWNYAREIYQNNRAWLEGGGQFIVPIPELRRVGAKDCL